MASFDAASSPPPSPPSTITSPTRRRGPPGSRGIEAAAAEASRLDRNAEAQQPFFRWMFLLVEALIDFGDLATACAVEQTCRSVRALYGARRFWRERMRRWVHSRRIAAAVDPADGEATVPSTAVNVNWREALFANIPQSVINEAIRRGRPVPSETPYEADMQAHDWKRLLLRRQREDGAVLDGYSPRPSFRGGFMVTPGGLTESFAGGLGFRSFVRLHIASAVRAAARHPVVVLTEGHVCHPCRGPPVLVRCSVRISRDRDLSVAVMSHYTHFTAALLRRGERLPARPSECPVAGYYDCVDINGERVTPPPRQRFSPGATTASDQQMKAEPYLAALSFDGLTPRDNPNVLRGREIDGTFLPEDEEDFVIMIEACPALPFDGRRFGVEVDSRLAQSRGPSPHFPRRLLTPSQHLPQVSVLYGDRSFIDAANTASSSFVVDPALCPAGAYTGLFANSEASEVLKGALLQAWVFGRVDSEDLDMSVASRYAAQRILFPSVLPLFRSPRVDTRRCVFSFFWNFTDMTCNAVRPEELTMVLDAVGADIAALCQRHGCLDPSNGIARPENLELRELSALAAAVGSLWNVIEEAEFALAVVRHDGGRTFRFLSRLAPDLVPVLRRTRANGAGFFMDVSAVIREIISNASQLLAVTVFHLRGRKMRRSMADHALVKNHYSAVCARLTDEEHQWLVNADAALQETAEVLLETAHGSQGVRMTPRDFVEFGVRMCVESRSLGCIAYGAQILNEEFNAPFAAPMTDEELLAADEAAFAAMNVGDDEDGDDGVAAQNNGVDPAA